MDSQKPVVPAVAMPEQLPVTLQWSRRIVDYVLAGCLCLAALVYWTWNSLTAPSAPAAANAAAVLPPATQSESDRLNTEGAQLYAGKQYATAEALFRRAIALNPSGALGFCNLGAVLVSEGRYDEAIAMLERSLALDPNFTLARNNLNWAIEEKAKHAK